MNTNHGANLHSLSEELGIKKEQIIDFSSNINPYGLSPKGLKALKDNLNLASIYPDPNYTSLKSSISEYCNCDPKNIVLGSGATELISSTIKVVNPKKTLLLSPAYSEYENELNKIGSEIKKVFYKKELNFKIDIDELISILNSDNFDLLVICNPNNPTGSLLTLSNLKEIGIHFKKSIMIDETYIEFTNFINTSAISLINQFNNFIVIRGTSKFFSTPGIRLGYAIIGCGDLLDRISCLPNLWNINIFASIMGEAMFKDLEFINMCHNNFKNDFNLLFNSLKSFENFKVYESNSNFILCEIIDSSFNATDLYNYLLNKGIIIRKAKSFDGLNDNFFRVCVLNKENIEILIEEISNFLKYKIKV